MIRYLLVAGITIFPGVVQAQSLLTPDDHVLLRMHLEDGSGYHFYHKALSAADNQTDGNGERIEYPDPTKVLYRSMMLPGWGQVTNRQIWKVPLIYAIFAGVGIYHYEINRRYQGYRAAHYNQVQGEDSDFRFGETPDFIPLNASSDQLRQHRDQLRNSRDFSYVIMGLAYGLNILDAYVYAHMRSFDVSDDLSANAVIAPDLTGSFGPGMKVRIDLFKKGGR